MKLIHQLDQPIVKKHILLVGSGFVLGILLYLYLKANVSINPIEFILSGICGALLSYVCYHMSKWLDNFIPWKNQLASRFITGIIGQFFVVFIIVEVLVYIYSRINGHDTFDPANNFSIKMGIILLILMLFYNSIYFALYSYYNYAKGQINKITYDRKQIDLQLKALKSQLSSHFLFNNLNTISALAHKDAKASEAYIRGLGTIYNYTLNSYNTSLVTIEEELTVALSYLKLLKTRFGDTLVYKISIPEDLLSTKIPPLTLQMLVENAVKHNQMDANHILSLEIIAQKDYLQVKNNITKAPAHITSFNIGLKNIEARYQLLYNQNITILNDSHFTVKIPLILS